MIQWTVRLEARTSAGVVTKTELMTFSRPAVVSTLADIGLMLDETKALVARLQVSMLRGQVAAYAAPVQQVEGAGCPAPDLGWNDCNLVAAVSACAATGQERPRKASSAPTSRLEPATSCANSS